MKEMVSAFKELPSILKLIVIQSLFTIIGFATFFIFFLMRPNAFDFIAMLYCFLIPVAGILFLKRSVKSREFYAITLLSMSLVPLLLLGYFPDDKATLVLISVVMFVVVLPVVFYLFRSQSVKAYLKSMGELQSVPFFGKKKPGPKKKNG